MKRRLLTFLFALAVMLILSIPALAQGGWTVVMWHGDPVELADGWQLCDGTNGTPDLQDQFIVGAGSTYTLADVGGTITTSLYHRHQVESHQHTISSVDLSHTHSVPSHNHTISLADLSHTHSVSAHTHPISSVNLAHTHAGPSHSHSISAADLSHVHQVNDHNHLIPPDPHQHWLMYDSSFSLSTSGAYQVGNFAGSDYLQAPSGGTGSTFYRRMRYTDVEEITGHAHGGLTGNTAPYTGGMSANTNHDHGGSTGLGGTGATGSALTTHDHGGVTGSGGSGSTGSALTTHDHGGTTGNWSGTSGAMSANSIHDHGGNTGYQSPYTDYQLVTADNRPPYYAVYYICKLGIIEPLTATMAITDPNTTQYYTTTFGTYAIYKTVSTGEQATVYVLIALVLLSAVNLGYTVVARRERRWF